MGYDEWNCPQCTFLHKFPGQRCHMCGSSRVTKEQMRNFVLGKKIDKSSIGSCTDKTTASSSNAKIESNEDGSKKRPIDVDSDDENVVCSSKVAKAKSPTQPQRHNIIEPIQRNPNFFIANDNESKRFIIYMAVREHDPSFSAGLAKCRAAYQDDEVNSCLQFDGTRHITMFDGYLTNEQARNLSYKYNRFENSIFHPIKLKIDGWMPWDAGCYLKIKPNGEKMLEAILKKIDGFPDPIRQSLQKNGLAKNGVFKFPCNHLSLYRSRPNVDRSKMKKSFGEIRKALANHDWGYVEGVGIRIKVMGEPYSDYKVIAGI
ncbi:hypothetical protein ACHAWO_012505 [Cyclotella atomus]|uniref:RanBP2-type domain-containing protein n=1 Tax=Cyclotella atomus TaxID=382360 RepID=A0ABD3NGP7_9STRA